VEFGFCVYFNECQIDIVKNWFVIWYLICNFKRNKTQRIWEWVIWYGWCNNAGWLVSSRLKANLSTILRCNYKTEWVPRLQKKCWPIMGFLIRVISVSGQLTDHYNPVKKQWTLVKRFIISEMQQQQQLMNAVMRTTCCGYEWLTMRSKLVPL
jgi:hypothetical protein